eukprot:6327749-Pyramimonas_sp.AAC.1
MPRRQDAHLAYFLCGMWRGQPRLLDTQFHEGSCVSPAAHPRGARVRCDIASPMSAKLIGMLRRDRGRHVGSTRAVRLFDIPSYRRCHSGTAWAGPDELAHGHPAPGVSMHACPQRVFTAPYETQSRACCTPTRLAQAARRQRICCPWPILRAEQAPRTLTLCPWREVRT